MADLITRCPECGTSFKLALEHLKTARGAVRCGSCLKVFRATEHWVTPLSDHQQKAINSILQLAPAKPKAPRKTQAAGRRRVPPPKPPQTASDAADPDDFLIDDDMHGQPSGELEFSDDFLTAFDPQRGDEQQPSIDESWTEDLLDDDDDAAVEPRQAAPAVNSELGDMSYHTTSESLDDIAREFGETENWQSAEREGQDESERKTSRTSLLDSIQPDALSFSHGQKTRAPRRKRWGVLSLLATIALALQLLYWNFPQWSRQPQLRPLYVALCEQISCQLPPQLDPAQIRSHSLIIRSHPTYDNALVVDTVLVNMANFDQPFPGLMLVFSDIHNRVIASRRFTPGEYLGGELAGAKLMPAKQPVHLSLEIRDPGKDAVNWGLKITH